MESPEHENADEHPEGLVNGDQVRARIVGFPEPFKVNWDLAGGWATSADLPGVRIPGAPGLRSVRRA